MDNKLDLILQKLAALETGQPQLINQVNKVKTELQAFRVETTTALQIIQTGQRRNDTTV